MACMASSCATMQAIEPVQRPPAEYQRSRPVLVEFVTPEAVMLRCMQRGAFLPSIACADREVITIGNPCAFGGAYAAILCHELGHANGWPPHHPR
jgi:hypothetical protein